MRKPDPSIKAALWERQAPEFRRAIVAMVNGKPTRERGEALADARIRAYEQLTKIAYEAGLDRGYDMGAEVFGDGGSDE